MPDPRPVAPTLLSINNYFYRRGGADVVFLEHNSLLEAAGWNVVPFSMQHPRNLPSEWSRYFIDELEFGSEYSFAEKVRRLPKVIYSMEARRKLASLLEVVTPRIAHAHNIYHHLSPSILGVLHAQRIPVVLTLHDLKIACPAYSMLANDGVCERCKGGRIYNVVLHKCVKNSLALSTVIAAEALVHKTLRSYERFVDKFVVPSRFFIRKLGEWGWPEERFHYIPNFVHPMEPVSGAVPGKRFVYIGRLSREKGLITLVRAAALSSQPVTLIGTGPQREELEGLVALLGADVEFAGFRSGKDLHDLIRAGRALVLPSECYENAPLSIMEAYALGKAVIGASIGGIPELIKEGETGITFQSGSPESLADALSRFAALPDRQLVQMGAVGHDWMAREFSPQIYKERVVALYQSVLTA